ncbi:MAG: amino acid adenylation domain-containing protein [Thermoanaerobaculales bacterium]|jgi:amino acid adenylation domain-containing protein|nr:amino acid adenylation domain-containing protein [Thermoanaerobaculales bacterium]
MSDSTSDTRVERLREAIRLKKASASARRESLPARPLEAPARLDELQRGIWLAHTMDPESPAYNLVSACRVRGELDPVAVDTAFARVVARHRLLRSTFATDGGDVLQIIHPDVSVELDRIQTEPGCAVETAIAVAKRPFDLETLPLIRLHLVDEAGGGERLLVLVLHHLLSDERSLAGLWRELAAAVAGELDAAEPAPQYDDWAYWRRTVDPEADAGGLDFWRRRLDPPPGDLELPFDRSVDVEGPRGRLQTLGLDDRVAERLRRFAGATGTTPFAIGAFAYRLLLQRLAGEDSFAFATPVSTRSHPSVVGMLGAFINPVVVPTAIDEDRTVDDEMRRFDRELRELLGHAATPFHTIAETLAPARNPGRHPLFQTMFVHQERVPLPEIGGARLEEVILDLGDSKFDLTLFLTDNDGALEVAAEFRADRFDDRAISRLLVSYAAGLSGLVEDPQRTVAEVLVLDAAELARIDRVSRGEVLDLTTTTTMPEQIHGWSRRTPDATAVRFGDDRLDFAALSRRAAAIERALGDAGFGPGDRIGVFLPRSVELVAGLVGIHRGGAAYVPLDPAYPAERNRQVLADAEVRAVLTTSALGADLPEGPWSVVHTESVGPGDETEPDTPTVDPGSAAYILYTSGSTGRPKGVVVTHGNLQASTAARLQVYGADPPRYLLLPSVAFDSSVAGIFGTLAAGGALVIPGDDEVLDPRRLAALIRAAGVTHLLCVPSLYARLLEADSEAASRLAVAIVAGESCPPALVAEHLRVAPDTRLFNEYGPTEGTVWATVHEMAAEDARRPVPIGRPIPGVRVDIVDHRGRPVPFGVPGRAWIAGPTVAEGYWRQPELTTGRFAGDPVDGPPARRYATGDLMSWTEDGLLRFHGREDEQLKIRGFRIEPGEIETALTDLDGVHRAAVVARGLGSDPAAADHLVAFVETVDGGMPDGWRSGLERQLPAHMIPTRLIVVEELPQLPNGKIDRGRLVEARLAPEDRPGDAAAAGTPREATLIAIWEGLLGRRGIGPDDNFFTLGGHSLLAVELALAIERDLGVVLPPAEVFANPTVRRLAARIDDDAGTDTPLFEHLFPIQPGGGGDPFIVAIPHFFADLFADRFRGERPVYGLRGVGHRPEGNLGRWRTMADLGRELVDEIEHRFPDRPLIIAGYSFGASMALEAVRILEQRGIPVRRLLLIAPMPFDIARLGPLRLQIDDLGRPVDQLTSVEVAGRWLRANSPLTLAPYRRLWRRVVVEGWRRWLCHVGRMRRALGLPLTERILWADVRVDRFRLHSRYRPGTVRTPTVIFNAVEPSTDAAATWRAIFEGPLTVVDSPDPHLDGGSVEAARRVILEHLDDLEDV